MTTKTPTAAEIRAKANAARDALRAAQEEADRLSAEALRAEYQERRAKEARENSEHSNRMYAEIGQPLAGLNKAQHGIVYALAWQQGHASGYDEVTGHYEELAEMAREILDAN